jgi:hypothetical protein
MKILQTIILVTITGILSYGQNSVYLEYLIQVKGTDKPTGRLIAYFNDGNSLNKRVDINSTNAVIDIIPKNSLNTTYRLSNNKTYFEMPDPQLEKYRVEYLKDEQTDTSQYKVIKVATHDSTDYSLIIWINDKIKDSDSYMLGSFNSIDYIKLKSALKEIGLNGLPVKIRYNVSVQSYEYVLTKYGKEDINLSLYTLDGYTKQKPMTLEQLSKEGKINKKQMKAMKKEQKRLMEEHRMAQ